MKIIVTGGTGLIGSSIIKRLTARGDEVTVFTRKKSNAESVPGVTYVEWNPYKEGEWVKSIDGKDAVIHLAGASIFGKRWNEDYKKKIMDSRILGTRNIVNAISKADIKPSVLAAASGAGYYGKDTGDRVISETDPPGEDFLAEVCIEWEEEASRAQEYNVRTVSMRTGIVLDKNDGALKQMLLPFRLFAGGPLGSGRQWFPWIHIDDLSDIYIRAVDDDTFRGSINASSPNPVRMKEFADTLGKVLHRPSWFRVPEFMMKMVVGEAAEFVTGGQRIVPEVLLKKAYNFKFPNVRGALEDLL